MKGPAAFAACLQIEDDVCSDFGCLTANPGTSIGSTSASCHKCLLLLVFVKPEGPAKKNFMYFSTERVANCLFELQIHLTGRDHCFLKLLPILEGLPPKNLANRNDAAYEGTARLTPSCDPSCQGTRSLEDSPIL